MDAGLEWTENIVLVALDGFTLTNTNSTGTPRSLGARCDGVNSRNFPGFASGKGRVFHATDCKSEWALHFSLVNANANDSLVDGVATATPTVGQIFYFCQTNRPFLPLLSRFSWEGRRCAASTWLIEPAYIPIVPMRRPQITPRERRGVPDPPRRYLRTSLQTFMRCGSPDSSH